MSTFQLKTPYLTLTLTSADAARASIENLPEEILTELSPDWLAQLAKAEDGDFWILGFDLQHADEAEPVGQCGFKGPPSSDGIVEIAYAVREDQQNRGFATEAALALTQFALEDAAVQLVCAHTLPEENASTRVLAKCGFKNVGEVIDPDDGPVWRWEFSG